MAACYLELMNAAHTTAANAYAAHDPIDFTFADDGDLVRKAPKDVPEDPVEKRVEQERKAAPHIAAAIEVRHGSGKVKV